MNPSSVLATLVSSSEVRWYFQGFVLLVIVGSLAVRYRPFWKDLYHFSINFTGLFAILVALYLVVYGQVLTSYGVHNLFWSNEPGVRFFSSFSAAMLLGLIGTLACHLDPHPRRTQDKIANFLGLAKKTDEALPVAGPSRSNPTPPDQTDGPTDHGQGDEKSDSQSSPAVPEQAALTTKHLKERPDRPHMQRLPSFLRAAGWPFLALLAFPALFPDLFPYLPPPAPLQEIYKTSLLALKLDQGLPVGLAGYLYGLLEWGGGIVAGVFLFEFFMWVSSKTRDLMTFTSMKSAKSIVNSLAATSPVAKWVVRLVVVLAVAIASLLLFGWTGALKGLAIFFVVLFPGFAWRIVIGVLGLFDKAFGFFNTKALRWPVFDGSREFKAVPVKKCEPTGGLPCPLGGCPATQPPVAAGLAGCLEHDDRWKSIKNLLFWFVFVYAGFAYYLYNFCLPSMAICLMLGLLAMASALLVYFQPARRITHLFVFLAYLVLLNNQSYKDRFEGMDVYYPAVLYGESGHPVKLREKTDYLYFPDKAGVKDPDANRREQRVTLISDDAAPTAWLKAVTPAWQKDPQFKLDQPKLVVVSVSGGASRSAYWSAVVLNQLSTTLGPTFDPSVRIITGTSGGMLGTACYVEQRFRESAHIPIGSESWLDQVPHDSLTALARYVALCDPARQLLPRVIAHEGRSGNIEEYDRGTILEKDWLFLQDRVFGSYSALEASGNLPSLIFSPMMIEDGRLLLISNLDLTAIVRPEDALRHTAVPRNDPPAGKAALPAAAPEKRLMTFSQGSSLTEAQDGTRVATYSLFGLEFFKLFPCAPSFRIATAVRMNATFPFISPAVSLPTDPPRHVVDAGYYDNYGMQVSTAWLHANREWLARHTSGVLLIQIRDSLSVMDRVDTDDHTTTPWEMISHGFDLVLNPIQAAARARSSTSMFRNDLEVEYLNDWFTMATGHRDFFTTVVFENPAAVASLPIRHDRTKLPGDDIIEALGGSASIVSATDTDPNKGRRMTEQVMSKLKLSHRINENISMNWFLAPSDMEAMKSTFPRTDDEGAKNTPEDRVKRLAQCAVLEQLVRILKDEPREYALRELVQLRNYDRLLTVKNDWWWEDHAPSEGAGSP